MFMSMSGNKKIKLKYIYDDGVYGFKKNQIYEGVKCKDKICGSEMVGIENIDGDGEEYAYPASWFEVIND